MFAVCSVSRLLASDQVPSVAGPVIVLSDLCFLSIPTVHPLLFISFDLIQGHGNGCLDCFQALLWWVFFLPFCTVSAVYLHMPGVAKLRLAGHILKYLPWHGIIYCDTEMLHGLRRLLSHCLLWHEIATWPVLSTVTWIFYMTYTIYWDRMYHMLAETYWCHPNLSSFTVNIKRFSRWIIINRG